MTFHGRWVAKYNENDSDVADQQDAGVGGKRLLQQEGLAQRGLRGALAQRALPSAHLPRAQVSAWGPNLLPTL